MGQRRRAIEYYKSELLLLEEIGSADATRIRNQIQEMEATFEFDILTIDASGHVAQRREGEARQFIEQFAGEVGLEMVEVPGGTFTMGSPSKEQGSEDNERPQHDVTISPFCIGKFAVTQTQWRVVAGWPNVERDLTPDPSYFKGDDRPVEQVSWQDAMEFCARLSNKTGRTYRLPTEGEWEYACRAGTQTPFAFGEAIMPEFVNYDGNYPYGKAPKAEYRRQTVGVGSLGVANAFGLYDMHGNVWEWCQDWYGNYGSEPVTDPTGPERGQYRVLRGGSWSLNGVDCRSACRGDLGPADRDYVIGFRVVVVSRTQ